MGLFLLVPAAAAYFDLPPPSRTLFHENERQASSRPADNAFVIYQRKDSSLSGATGASLLQYRSNHFVPADTIPINQPIHMMLRRPIESGRDFENLLYANLKLKRLLEEYAALQQRARELLSGTEGGDARLLKNAAHPGSNIYRLQENLKHQITLLSRGAHALPALQTPPGNGQPASAPDLLPALTAVYRSPDDTKGGDGRNAPGIADLSAAGEKRSTGGEGGVNVSLPWILEVVLGILSYFMANKLEAILYGVLLMAVIVGISGLRRH